MATPRLANLDLSLLRAFLVLYRVRSTTQAAEELHVSQPAVSQMLSRMREFFDDPLFVRSQRGFLPTARADRLADTLPEAISLLESVCTEHIAFQPSQLEGKCKIALQTIAKASFAEELFFALHTQAPNLELEFHYWETRTIDALFSGEMDLGINYYSQGTSKEIYQDVLFEDQVCALVRKEHPLATKKKLTTQEFFAQDLCTCIVQEFNVHKTLAEEIGEKMGMKVNMVLRSSNLATLVKILQKTDLVLPGQRLFLIAHPGKLAALDIEGFSDISVPVAIYLHQRNRYNPKYKWLASVARQVIQDKMNKESF